MSLATILLQAAPATPGTGGGYTGILMLILIFVVFYFFLIRPQSKRQKEKLQKQLLKNIFSFF